MAYNNLLKDINEFTNEIKKNPINEEYVMKMIDIGFSAMLQRCPNFACELLTLAMYGMMMQELEFNIKGITPVGLIVKILDKINDIKLFEKIDQSDILNWDEKIDAKCVYFFIPK